jgi:hypothetical protein
VKPGCGCVVAVLGADQTVVEPVITGPWLLALLTGLRWLRRDGSRMSMCLVRGVESLDTL